MKTIRVLQQQSSLKKEKFSPLSAVMVNSKTDGNFRVAKSKMEKLQIRQL